VNLISAKLETEAVRFTERAKEIALDVLKNPSASDAAKKRFTAECHLIRAETYKAAARIALQFSGEEKT
jgi:hypothetical protein